MSSCAVLEFKLFCKVDSQGADVTNCPVQNSKATFVIDLFFQPNGFQSSLVEELVTDPNFYCFMVAHEGLRNKRKRVKN